MLGFVSSNRILLVAGSTDLRKRFNALSAIMVNALKKNPLTKAYIAVAYMPALYRIEREAKALGFDAAAKVKLRQEKAKPLIEEFEGLIREFGKRRFQKVISANYLKFISLTLSVCFQPFTGEIDGRTNTFNYHTL